MYLGQVDSVVMEALHAIKTPFHYYNLFGFPNVLLLIELSDHSLIFIL